MGPGEGELTLPACQAPVLVVVEPVPLICTQSPQAVGDLVVGVRLEPALASQGGVGLVLGDVHGPAGSVGADRADQPEGVPVTYPEVGGPPLADVGVVGQQTAPTSARGGPPT